MDIFNKKKYRIVDSRDDKRLKPCKCGHTKFFVKRFGLVCCKCGTLLRR